MINETQFVLESFVQNFGKFKNEPLVIYGLGKNTQAVLAELTDYNVVGLMDEVRTGEIFFGKKVISCNEALDLGVKDIVIIARASNVPIIYRRIAEFCTGNGISVYDINGSKQTVETYVFSELPKEYEEIDERRLLASIDQSEVISFDIFDTLLMRNVLVPHDVFYILEEKLIKKYGEKIVEGYAKIRIKSEQDLYLTKQPNLIEIYEEMNRTFKVSRDILEDWLSLELYQESECLIARQKMISIFNYALRAKKDICLTSDMYLSSQFLKEILAKNGYTVKDIPILVSNEQGVAKYNGLFKMLRNRYAGKKILHVGDNEEADIKASLTSGIDSSFYIKSSYAMLGDSISSELLKYTTTLANRICIGQFISKQFNDPFVFGKTKGKLIIDSEYDIGYSFIAPAVVVFLNWLVATCEEENINQLLLASRDGYLIEKLLDLLKELNVDLKLPKYQYFYASRSVCLISGLRNEKDIEYAASLAFSGSVQELIVSRFGVKPDELLVKKDSESEIDYVLRHKSKILDFAESVKKNYIKYINKQKIDENSKVGFFDFVSSGTSQMAMEHFLPWDIVGLYFARLYDEHKEHLYIKALCPETTVYKNQLAIIGNYFFMENVFTSFEPTLTAFDNEGNPMFGRENRGEKQLESLNQIQTGITDAFKGLMLRDYKLDLSDLGLADIFIKYISSEYSILNLTYFMDNPLMDEFCNRSFNLAQI